MLRGITAVLAAFALSGCGDAIKELLPHASCTNAALGTCQDYSGPAGTALSTFQDACASAAGTNGTGECALTNRIGSCSIPTGVPGVTTVTRFYSPAWNSTTAPANCGLLGGAYTPG